MSATLAAAQGKPASAWRPGRGLLSAVAVALSLAGLGVATYLSVVHYAHQPIACNGLGDCEYVNSSEYAKVVGVPVAVLGAAAYASMALLVAASWLRRDAMLALLAWGIGLASLAFSAYLTYIELEVLEAICVYCVVSATVMTALFVALCALAWTWRHEILGDGHA